MNVPSAPGRPLRYVPVLLAFLAVFVAAINLRAGIASLGSVLDDVLTDLDAGGPLAGVVTAMPGLFFAIMGLAAVPLASKLGLSKMLTGGMVLTLIGLAVRPWVGDIWIFIALTAFVVAGIALANVLLPAWIKNHGGRHIVALMTIYTSVLGLSGALGPLSALLFSGDDAWRWALFIWAFLAAAQVVVWVFVAARTGYDFPSAGRARVVPAGASDTPPAGDSRGTSAEHTASDADEATHPDAEAATQADTDAAAQSDPTGARGSLWRAPTALFLMLFFGLQSMNAYIQMGWLPQIYVDSGVSASVGSVALAMVGGLNVVGGLVMPVIIDRVRRLELFPVLFSGLTALGYLGLYLATDTVPLLWALLLGLGGFCFPTALALIPARSRNPLVTARVSGFVQPFGYIVAAVGPFLVGVVYGETGEWSGILLVLVAVTVVMALFGYRASRRGFIDDELAAVAA
ncbi:MFS transporter [Brevibacterium yomogidense]|uniref:MFS transporter n=1 Tax=Brevibacterium yomogidense TaxID=946573 RepID=UPI0018E05861|nr:MFS transporter [Brevibacterium yomogidense]